MQIIMVALRNKHRAAIKDSKGPVIIYDRGGGRRENVSKPNLFLTQPFIKTI